jgi:serine/threonine protein kinase
VLPLDTTIRGRYRLTERLASADIPALYTACDEHEGREVAVEVYPLGEAGRAASAERLDREVAALKAVNCRCLPAIYGTASEADCFLLVREHVVGVSLAERVQLAGPWREAQLRDWAAQLLDDLAEMHERSPALLHGRIAPDALVVDQAGGIRLRGYRLRSAAGPAERETLRKGDPYAAPETVLGALPDRRSDLYALGAVVFHALTGAPPPLASLRIEKAALQQPDPLQPVHVIRPELPAVLGEAVSRSLAIRPRDRFQSAREMREALLGAATAPPEVPADEPQTEQAINPSRRLWLWLSLAGLTLTIGALALLLSLFSPHNLAVIDAATAPQIVVIDKTSLTDAVSGMTFDPQGRLAVGQARKLVLLDEKLNPAGETTFDGTVNDVAVTGNGAALAVALQQEKGSVQEIRRDPQLSATQLPLGEAIAPARAVAVSPGETRIAAGGRSRSIAVQPLDGSGPVEPLVDPEAATSVGVVAWLAFLGETELVSASTEPGGSVRIWSENQGWKPTRLLTPQGGGMITALAVDAQRRLVVVASRDGAGQTGALLSVWRLDGVAAPAELSVEAAMIVSLDISPQGTLLAAGLSDGAIEIYDISGATATRIWRLPPDRHKGREVRAVRFSEDGRVLATADDGGELLLWGAP